MSRRLLARAVVRGLAALGRVTARVRGLAPTDPDAIGRRGEREAERALRREGYRILARRLRTTGGEIDLLALDRETLVLVEVKASLASSRSGPAGPRPSDRVDHRKRRRLVGASRALARGRFAGSPRRIDVVSVVLDGRRAEASIVRGAVRLTRGA